MPEWAMVVVDGEPSPVPEENIHAHLSGHWVMLLKDRVVNVRNVRMLTMPDIITMLPWLHGGGAELDFQACLSFHAVMKTDAPVCCKVFPLRPKRAGAFRCLAILPDHRVGGIAKRCEKLAGG